MSEQPKRQKLYPAYSGPVQLRQPRLTSAERKRGREAVAGFHERQRALAAAPHAAAKRERSRLLHQTRDAYDLLPTLRLSELRKWARVLAKSTPEPAGNVAI